jgi:DNA invertase Pin-like site-specific DNA recombinase
MRAVIYARYSSDNQREASIEDQVRLAHGHIESRGWTYLHAYNDRAISGASALRPGYQRLLADARDGQFDVVVAEALDRLSRDQEDVAALYKRLSFAGIRIVTLAEGEVSELHVGLKGTMNALFLKDLAQKTRRGLEGRVREGRSAGGLCYGYTVVRETDARGEPVRGGRRIDEAEAAVVRRIFEQFATGMSANAIAKQLNAEGVPRPRGLLWRDTAIRGHRQRGTGILNNELYIGRLVWNRLRYSRTRRPASVARCAMAPTTSSSRPCRTCESSTTSCGTGSSAARTRSMARPQSRRSRHRVSGSGGARRIF